MAEYHFKDVKWTAHRHDSVHCLFYSSPSVLSRFFFPLHFYFLVSQFSSDRYPLCQVYVVVWNGRLAELSPLGSELVSIYLQQGSCVQSWAGTFIGLIYDYRPAACQATLPLLGKFVYLLCFSGDVKTSGGVMSYFRGHSDALVWRNHLIVLI